MPLTMLEKVRSAIDGFRLADPREPLWVAVSGGVDSMVLLHVLRRLGHPCHVAHMDHGLRGSASDGDRELVRAYCDQRNIPFSVKRVDVRARMAATGDSLQMAARALRREYFDQLAVHGPHKVAMAHHMDDAVETFLLGMIQGLGAKGWGSIPVRSGVFIRPLSAVTRQEILAYAAEHHVPWREDASNADTGYLRNRVRHELLPLLEQWRPGTRINVARNLALFNELDTLGRMAADRALHGLEAEADGTLRIPFARIMGPSPRLILYHLLREKGFHPDRFEDMLLAMRAGRTGARFPGPDAEVFVDRECLVVAPLRERDRTWVFDLSEPLPDGAPIKVASSTMTDIKSDAGVRTVWLDADRIRPPLLLRPWVAGDRMRPDGLSGSKLISDILIDAKVPRDRKARIHVLADAERIIWLCGMRLAEGVKAGPNSSRVFRFTWNGS